MMLKPGQPVMVTPQNGMPFCGRFLYPGYNPPKAVVLREGGRVAWIGDPSLVTPVEIADNGQISLFPPLQAMTGQE